MVGKPEPRYVTPEAAAKLRDHFNLPLEDYDDHWEIMCHFGERTEDFLTYYETPSDLTEDDRFALMAMVICSLDERIPDQRRRPASGRAPAPAARGRFRPARVDGLLLVLLGDCAGARSGPRPYLPRHAPDAHRLVRAQGAS